jgi:hypothetical protein
MNFLIFFLLCRCVLARLTAKMNLESPVPMKRHGTRHGSNSSGRILGDPVVWKAAPLARPFTAYQLNGIYTAQSL